MNILECTVKMKREKQAHYGRLADSVEDNGMKRLLSLLAAEEGEYIGKLAKLEADMNFRNIPGIKALEEGSCVYIPHIDPRYLAETLEHDPDAYRHVVREEEETIEFFDHLGDQAENEELKKFYRLQAARERKHLNVLENIYFFVEEPRTYLEWGEFSNLKTL